MTPNRATAPTNIGIQILRGLAASAVVIHHTMEETRALPTAMSWPDWAVRAGAVGVDVFFVISGFVMYLSIFERPTRPSPADFLLGRAQRIFPLYWFCLVAVVALWATGLAFRSAPVGWATILKDVLLLPHEHYVITVAWTLVYEMYFYITLAFVMAFALNQTQSLTATLATLALLFTVGSALPEGETGRFLSNPIVIEFCYGLMLAHFASIVSQRLNWPVAVIVVGALVSLLSSELAPADDTGGLNQSARFVAWGLPALMIVAGFERCNFSRLRGHRMLVRLGDASYAVYLTHAFVMIAYARALKSGVMPLPSWLAVFAVAAVALSLGLIAHYAIEKPVTALVKRLVSMIRKQPMAQPAGL